MHRGSFKEMDIAELENKAVGKIVWIGGEMIGTLPEMRCQIESFRVDRTILSPGVRDNTPIHLHLGYAQLIVNPPVSIPQLGIENLHRCRAPLRVWFIQKLVAGEDSVDSTYIERLDPPGAVRELTCLQAWTPGAKHYF